LKSVIVHRGLCIALAGGVISGQDAIRDVANAVEHDFSLDEVVHYLEKVATRSGNDFIVAALFPAPTLIRVEPTGTTPGVSSAWIGSRPAFAAYQSYYGSADQLPRRSKRWRTPLISAEEQDAVARMAPSMMQVIEDQDFPEVGGLPIFVAPTRRGFCYESVAMLAADHEQVINPEDGWVDADWGTAAQGSFGYALKVPDEAGVGAIGAYFPHGRLGVLYYPGRYEQAIAWREVGDQEFCDAVEDEFGISFGRRSLGFS
jgi:hypothetical protein